MEKNKKVFNNVLELVGNTPLIKLNKITSSLKGNYFDKVEAFNPGHSSKDRIALYIIEEAERKGILKPGSTIVETTSGNTGFSIAMVSIIKGYKCILAVSSKSSADKIDMLKSMGAQVDRKSTRLNSSHVRISYAVFCLKKKKPIKQAHQQPQFIQSDVYFDHTGHGDEIPYRLTGLAPLYHHRHVCAYPVYYYSPFGLVS